MALLLPNDSDVICERIFEAAKKLVEYNYWEGIDDHVLSAWLNNFTNREDRYIAATLLYSLIYRNSPAVRTFGAQLFHIIIPNYLEEKSIYTFDCIDSWLHSLNQSGSRAFLPFRFTTIEAIDNKPAKSGATIFRELKRHFFDGELGINCQSLENLKRNKIVTTLIIFDDIVGTGEQFETFVKKYNINELGFNVLYCPLAAHEGGIQRINDIFPNIDLRPIEILTDRHSLFSKENKMFELDNVSRHKEFMSLFEELCERKEFKISPEEFLGKGKLALTYLFKDSTPNNNISAIWYGDDNWTKLAKR